MREITKLFTSEGKNAIPVEALYEQDMRDFLSQGSKSLKTYAENMNFEGKAQQVLIVPLPDGRIERVLFGLGKAKNPYLFGALSNKLPEGIYRFSRLPKDLQLTEIAIFWALGLYRFSEYRKRSQAESCPCLFLSEDTNKEEIKRLVKSAYWVRDLINTPPNDMGPENLSEAALHLAETYHADCQIIMGEALERDFPLVHAVGKAAQEAPRIAILEWGVTGGKQIVVAGKGVCFDSGGLDLKSASGMRIMKKDMGGAAHALGLAYLIMDAQLPITLKMIIPCVENAVSGNAFRPGDILKSRNGLTVEIDNTDAEGRLVLADCLAAMSENNPDLILDFATLTGAARIALGPSISPYYTEEDRFAEVLEEAAKIMHDPVWRLPLWTEYNHYLKSSVADLKNSDSSGMAGSVTAALFLQNFVKSLPWIHFDIYGWTPRDKPSFPAGGQAMALFSTYHMLKTFYSKRGSHKVSRTKKQN